MLRLTSWMIIQGPTSLSNPRKWNESWLGSSLLSIIPKISANQKRVLSPWPVIDQSEESITTCCWILRSDQLEGKEWVKNIGVGLAYQNRRWILEIILVSKSLCLVVECSTWHNIETKNKDQNWQKKRLEHNLVTVDQVVVCYMIRQSEIFLHLLVLGVRFKVMPRELNWCLYTLMGPWKRGEFSYYLLTAASAMGLTFLDDS